MPLLDTAQLEAPCCWSNASPCSLLKQRAVVLSHAPPPLHRHSQWSQGDTDSKNQSFDFVCSLWGLDLVGLGQETGASLSSSVSIVSRQTPSSKRVVSSTGMLTGSALSKPLGLNGFYGFICLTEGAVCLYVQQYVVCDKPTGGCPVW